MRNIVRNSLISSIQSSFETIPRRAYVDLGNEQYDSAYKEETSMSVERQRNTGLGTSTVRMLVSTDVYEDPSKVIAVNLFEDVKSTNGSIRIQEIGGTLEYELGLVDLARTALMMKSLSRSLADRETTVRV